MFPGQYFDSETGLHYNWHRYYDPQLGRYITSDPIGLAGGPNNFSYSELNSLIYTDSLGLSTLPNPIGDDGVVKPKLVPDIVCNIIDPFNALKNKELEQCKNNRDHNLEKIRESCRRKYRNCATSPTRGSCIQQAVKSCEKRTEHEWQIYSKRKQSIWDRYEHIRTPAGICDLLP